MTKGKLFIGGEEIRLRADYDERKAQAEKRAQWELGDPSWASVILAAFLFPEEDAASLYDEMNEE